MASDPTSNGIIIPDLEVEVEVEKDMVKQVAELNAFLLRCKTILYFPYKLVYLFFVYLFIH